MKAVFFDQHGDLDVLQYGELQDPKPQPGWVLVRLHAAALNHVKNVLETLRSLSENAFELCGSLEERIDKGHASSRMRWPLLVVQHDRMPCHEKQVRHGRCHVA